MSDTRNSNPLERARKVRDLLAEALDTARPFAELPGGDDVTTATALPPAETYRAHARKLAAIMEQMAELDRQALAEMPEGEYKAGDIVDRGN